MAIIAGPEGSLQRGGPLATIPQIYTNQNVPGGGGPGFFESVMGAARDLGKKGQAKYTALGGTKALAGRYMPLLAGGLALASDPTNIGGAAGTGLGGVAGAALGAPLGPVGMLAGSALGSVIGGGLGSAAQNLLVGGAQAAGRAITGQQREAGISPGIVPGTGTGVGFSDADVKRLAELSRLTGQSQVDIARQMFPVSEQYRAAEAQRQMQLNQQTAQLTGALNRQLYMAQLAGGAQAQAGETTRTMMTAANPYAQSAFQYRG